MKYTGFNLRGWFEMKRSHRVASLASINSNSRKRLRHSLRSIRVIPLTVIFLFVVTPGALFGQTEDVTPPALVSLSIAPSTVDVTAGPATVTLTLHITDNLSGFDGGAVLFISPSGQQVASGGIAPPPISGSANDGIYQIVVTISRFVESGTWTLAFVDLRDKVGNRSLIRTPELQAAGFPTTLAVTSVPDVNPPVLADFSFTPSTVDVSNGAATFTLMFHITDDLSGFDSGGVLFISPSGQQVASGSIGMPPQSGNLNDGAYQGAVTISLFAESGTWTLAFVDLRDKVGNRALIRTPELQAAGFPTTLSVVSVQDVKPPDLLSFSFAPSTVDVSAGPETVMITAHITDDISGFESGGVLFISPSGQQVASGTIARPPVSGNVTDGVYQATLTIPRFAESGVWTLAFVDLRDQVGNRALIRTPELQISGFPIELTVRQELQIQIDIKPGGFPNSVNPKSKGVIPVAILTTSAFDASTVDLATVRFGASGTEAVAAHSALEDVDGDGDLDLILHFNTQETGIVCGNTSASLTGKTFGGQPIKGSDSINTVECK